MNSQKNKRFSSFLRLITLLCCLFSTAGCMTGSTLRTARVLEKNHVEFSAGVARTTFSRRTSPVVIGAYGITDQLEIEGRWEDLFGSVTPRFQLLKSESAYVDGLVFFELGYGLAGFQWGPGVMVGRRWKVIEPYISYRFRNFPSVSRLEKRFSNEFFRVGFGNGASYQYLTVGSRFYFSDLWVRTENDAKLRSSKWFIGLEGGPIFSSGSTIFEWAINFGFDY